MTLLIGLWRPHTTCLLADRRITIDGRLVDDETNKVCVFFGENARVALAFTGLAKYGTFTTQQWLLETLSKVSKNRAEFGTVINRLCEEANDVYKAIPAPQWRLCILVTGYVYDASGPTSICVTISNLAVATGESFLIQTSTAAVGDAGVICVGATSLTEQARSRLVAIMNGRATPTHIVRAAVQELQAIAADRRSCGLIGAQCNSAVVGSDLDTAIISTYHSAHVTNRAYGADVVISDGPVAQGVEILTANIVAGPDMPKSALCWCGSGRKFGNCHRKTFGSIYAGLGVWKRPLPFGLSVVFKRQRACGSVFAVSSSFD